MGHNLLLILLVFGAAVLFGVLIVIIFILTPQDRAGLVASHSTYTTADGADRRYRVVTPRAYEQNEASYPLVVMLHGYRDNGKQLQLYSGMSNLGEAEGFITLYPEGVARSWNGDVCCGEAWQSDVDDSAYIKSLIDKVSSSYRIDEDRIFIVGYSNGGLLAQKLLNDLPETFAAGVSIMAGGGSADSLLDISSASAPLLLINGDSDNLVPLNDEPTTPTNDGFRFISSDATLAMWKTQYRCEQDAEVEETPRIRKERYSCGTTPLHRYIYTETPHRWPEWRLASPRSSVPQSSHLVWQFLDSYSR